ncbi:MAG: hypothetical protein GXP41_09025 [Chloroflexi bacterium]|nr:hypothetical protein [Chloroflexota bacterium]
MTAAQRRILTFALLSFALALLVARGFLWARASMNGFDASKAALGGEPAFAAHAVSPAQATSVTTLTAPKWLEAPTLDGQCTDAAYDQAGTVSLLTQAGGPGAEAKLLHSGLDFYICFSAIPDATGENVVVRVDSDHSRSRLLMPGDYRFSVDAAGQISVTQGMTTGLWTPISVPAGDITAVVTSTVTGGTATWNAELRLSLEWMGGYMRTDGLSLAVEQADGTVVQQWPLSATPQLPATWGDLVLAPLYTDTVTAASAFLDGREGYLVVPYASDLNPAEITIEAWVKVVDGDCGTLVGNGRDASYWLAFCRMIQFGHDGADSVEAGQHPLGDGWHHVAVTMDAAKGIRTFYLDGQVDTHIGWKPAQEEQGAGEPESLGTSDRMLRIGSDRDAPAEVDHLHSYVSELRIWNRVRTAAEIQADAFRRLSGAEARLIALWPFTNGLQDIAGGHDAGLVGNASLAKEGRDVESFPPTPTPVPYTYPTPEPIPAWDSSVPASTGEITVDGVCGPSEYAKESPLILEPDHFKSMHMVAAADALYLCTNIVWGGHGLTSTITLWINRDGQGGTVPGPSDLRLRLLPDGSLAAGTGDGVGYGGAAPAGVTNGTVGNVTLDLQEDFRPVDSPWWSSELRIPLEALAPYSPGQALRFALSYEGTIAAVAVPGQTEDVAVVARWPASFDPQQPDTWGVATTEGPALFLPLVAHEYAGRPVQETVANVAAQGDEAEAGSPTLVTTDQAVASRAQQPSTLADWPRPAPTESDFDAKCPGPNWQHPEYLAVPTAKWPRVDPNISIAQAEGTLTGIEVAGTDSPFIHSSHDLDMHVSLRPEDRWLSLSTQNGQTISGGSDLVLETESALFDERTMPAINDHVTVKGRWIFDCGHDPKTEIHPIPMFETDRVVELPDGIGSTGHRVKVRVARVWMNSDPGAFGYNLSALGSFTFNLDYPPPSVSSPPQLSNWGNDLLFFRVVAGSASNVAVTGYTGNGIRVTIKPPGASGQHYFEVMLGYLDPMVPTSASGKLFTVSLDKIDIKDDEDGFPKGAGEWYFFVAINSTWKKLFTNTKVDTGESYSLNRNIYLLGNDWNELYLRAIGIEADDEVTNIVNDFNGDDILDGTDASSSLGTLSSLCCGVQHAKETAHWKLYYTLHQGYAGLRALPENDSWYWAAHLGDEPNDDSYFGYNLGTLPVPGEGAPAHVTEHSSYVNQQALVKNGVYLLSNDVDRYQFALADFADVSFGYLPYGVHVHVDLTYPWAYSGDTPPDLENLIGYKSARINVHGDSPAVTDQQYTLKVYTTWRTLPPDWGEDQDTISQYTGVGGRLVDLVTPDPDTVVVTETLLHRARRRLTKDWAWQHVKGDLDYYDVWIPPVKEQPPIHQPPCEYDTEGMLRLTAYGMRLQVVANWGTLAHPEIVFLADQNDAVTLTNLNGKFPSGHAYVRVQSPTEQRGWYRLQAEWNDAKFYTPVVCSILRAKDKMSDFAAINWKSVYFPQLDIPDPSPVANQLSLYSLGGYQPVGMEQSGTLDTIVSSAGDQPVIARLYDMNGVLLGEGVALGEESAGETVADGQVPQSRLTVGGLSANEYYLMQVVPAFDVGPAGVQDVPVGFTQQAAINWRAMP